jgi:hypothetical protein
MAPTEIAGAAQSLAPCFMFGRCALIDYGVTVAAMADRELGPRSSPLSPLRP